jgi:YD repeat-containing protein
VQVSKNGRVISAYKTEYEDFLPSNEKVAHVSGLDILDNGTPSVDAEYEAQVLRKYRSEGDYVQGEFYKKLLIEEKYADGTVLSFLYDENDRLRILVVGLTIEQLNTIATNYESITSLSSFKTSVALLNQDTQVTTANYCRYGISSKTDANGITTYYDYDDFGRLECIKDSNGDIVKALDYNYKR